MGIKTREVHYDIQSETEDDWEHRPIEFYNECLFVEHEIMEKYNKEFHIDPRFDKSYKRFTKEEQIERYAKNFMFWWKLYNEEEEQEPNTPRFYYIRAKKNEFTKRMNAHFNDEPDTLKQIQKRIIDLKKDFEIEQENLDIQEFVSTYPYPSYDEVIDLIKGNVAMYAEYGVFNHSMMEKMYCNILDKERVKVIGKLIYNRGGMTAMNENFSAFMVVVRHLLRKMENKNDFELNAIQYNVYNEINKAWDRIGLWRA